MGIISVVISVAPALGPTVGGFVLSMSSWHVIFWTMAPLLGLICAAGYFRLVNVGISAIPAGFPVRLSVFAFGGLVYAVSSLENMLEGDGLVDIVVLIVGLVALALFTRRQLRLAKDNRALLDMRPFTVPNFTVAVLGMLLMFGLLLGVVNILPIYLQTSLAVSSLVTGLVVMPGGLLQGGISPMVGRLYDIHGPRPLMIPGALLLAAGTWLMTLLNEDSAVWMVIGMHILLPWALRL